MSKMFLNQARASLCLARDWFLEIAFACDVSVCVCVCVCVCEYVQCVCVDCMCIIQFFTIAVQQEQSIIIMWYSVSV